ncbi:hypothetical protein OAJ02_06395, partial [Nitrosopumilus sp.]|nr:hypothetical protein [Nitrosopumilus sp.]
MNNEIGRKLTSLTLMTIMLAGGMVIAAPSMVPEAAAAGLLFVSAENADFNNTFGGAQIVEVIVRDPARDETDEKQGEPTVKVDEHLLRMTQGSDGYWYAYFGSVTHIEAADAADNNLDFGQQTAVVNTNIVNSTGSTFTTAGNMGARGSAVTGGQCTAVTTDCGGVITNYPALSNYNGTWQGDGTGGSTKGSPNGDGSYHVNGQIGVTSGTQGEWPFIQTFDFTIGEFDVRLEQAGADEVVSLDYDNADLDDYAGIELDRTSASQGSEVHLTITDNQLNIDPTSEDIVTFLVTSGSESVSFNNGTNYGSSTGYLAFDNSFDDNGKLIINYNANGAANAVLVNEATLDDTSADDYLVFWETAENSGIFVNTDDDDDSNLDVNASGNRGTTALIDYNDSAQSFVIANDFGVIDMVESSVGDEWNSGEELTVTLIDQDLNKNTASDEDLSVSTSTAALPIPSLKIGSPLMVDATAGDLTVDSFSNIARITNATENIGSSANFTIHTGYTGAELKLMNTSNTFFNWDFTSFENSTVTVTGVTAKSAGNGLSLTSSDHNQLEGTIKKGMAPVYNVGVTGAGTAYTGEIIIHVSMSADMDGRSTLTAATAPFVADIFSFGDGVNNAIYRLELEESGDNTGVFEGSIEYRMLNQLNVDQQSTFIDLETISDTIDIIVHEDLTDEDSPRVNYLDLGADGVSTQIADQLEAPSHSGVVSFDLDNYKIADTVVVTLDDQDMNTDSELIDVYVTSTTDDKVGDGVGDHVLDITFDDLNWQDMDNVGDCDKSALVGNEGLAHTGFTLVETGLDSGIFVGSFQIPNEFCNGTVNTATTGKDLEVNYQDFRDASGQTIEVGDGASINANTGSVAFDRTVYPVPWGTTTAVGFAEHASASGSATLGLGNVTVHVRVTDADYDISAAGEDSIADTTVVLKIERGSTSVDIATFGNAADPMIETAPDSGVFEWDQQVGYTDGPTNSCPSAFSAGCVLQGDIITATYTDKDDASGQDQTVTDSATFDLRNGVLQSDKSVYLIGSDMILTLIEPDFDRDNDETESYTLDLIEWDSDAATTTLGTNGISGAAAAFDPEPSKLRETGDSTGIFQVVIEIPDTLDSELLDRGEMVELEYTDWGPAGADYVGQEDEDIGLVIYTSNFG